MSQAQRDLLPALIQIAEVNLPQLKHEIDTNGSALYKLQAAVSELHTIVTYCIHHMIDERRRLMALGGATAAAPTATATPTPAQAPQRFVPATVQRPTLPPLGAAAPIAPLAPSPGPAAVDRGPVMEVTITPAGTRATVPGIATPIVVPPGTPIDKTMLAASGVPTGEGEIVLPQGGEMSPEVAAALAASGGARNVTADPLP
jgi:hypothetical protein